MVTNRKEHTQKTPGKQAPDVVIPKPIKIGAATPYDFQGSNMTAYGGLLPVVTMLEKLQFQELIEQHVTIKRLTTSMPGFRFVLAMILALYVGFSRLNHLQFLGREPILTFLAETREYVGGELRKGDRPTGKQIAHHLDGVFAALPKTVERVYARADSGFYCREAVEAYEKQGCWFVLSAQKTSRLVEELRAARWTGSPRTDADGQCEFRYQPEGWGKAYRFIALRYQRKPKPNKLNEPEQYQLL